MDLSCGEGGSTGSEIVNAINQNTSDILSLEALLGGFYYDKLASEVLDIGTTPTAIVELIVPAMPVGVYFIGYSTVTAFDEDNQSLITGVEINGVTTVFSVESKDKSDIVPTTYNFIHVQSAVGDYTITIYLSKEAVEGQLDCHDANLWVGRQTRTA